MTREIGVRDGEIARGSSDVATVALVRVSAEDMERRFLGEPVVRRTLRRVRRVDGVRRVVVLSEDAGAVRERLASWGIEGVRVADDARSDEQRRVAGAYRTRVERGRLLCRHAWRSGHLPTVWDEAIEPEWGLMEMEREDAGAALVLGGGWCLFDIELAGELIRRHGESPEQHPMAFAGIGAGLSACVVGRKLMGDLVEGRSAGSAFATLAAVLGYAPTKPRRDPMATSACVHVGPAARDVGTRCVVDGLADVGLLEAALGEVGADGDASAIGGAVRGWIERGGLSGASPSELVFEVGGGACGASTRGRWFGRVMGPGVAPLLDAGVVERAVSGVASMGVAPVVTLAGCGGVDGTGDAAAHGGLRELIAAARGAGAAGVFVRTDLCGAGARVGCGVLETLRTCDGVHVDLLAQTADVYAGLTGRDAVEGVRADAELLWRGMVDGGAGDLRSGWLIPRITRCDAVYGEIEAFVDAWLLTVGVSAVDPLPVAVGGDRIAPLTEPRLDVLRRAASRVFVRSGGGVWLGEPWSGAFGDERTRVVGDLSREGVEGVWRRMLRERAGVLGLGTGAGEGGGAREAA